MNKETTWYLNISCTALYKAQESRREPWYECIKWNVCFGNFRSLEEIMHKTALLQLVGQTDPAACIGSTIHQTQNKKFRGRDVSSYHQGCWLPLGPMVGVGGVVLRSGMLGMGLEVALDLASFCFCFSSDKRAWFSWLRSCAFFLSLSFSFRM